MRRLWEILANLNARAIFALVLVGIVLALLLPSRVEVSESTRSVYRAVHGIRQGGVVFIGLEQGTGTEALLEQAKALLRHVLGRGGRAVIAITADIPRDQVLDVTGGLEAVAEALGRPRYGHDYAVVLLRTGGEAEATLAAMVVDIRAGTGHQDVRGRALDLLPLFEGFRSLRGADLLAGLVRQPEGGQGNPGLEVWSLAGQQATVPVVGGIVATRHALAARLVESGALRGVLYGVRSAAEYDLLLGGETGFGRAWGGASLLALLLVALIVVASVSEWLQRGSAGSRRPGPPPPGRPRGPGIPRGMVERRAEGRPPSR